jgi:hypothetical protein
MHCPEYQRLRQHYEVAIRRWGQVLLSPQATLVGALFRQAEEIKQKAFYTKEMRRRNAWTLTLRIPAEADQHSWMKPITIPV